jgi:hypothetical protein
MAPGDLQQLGDATASSEAPQTAAFIEKEPSRPALLLIVEAVA